MHANPAYVNNKNIHPTARCERTDVVANEGIDVVDVRAHIVVTRLAHKSVDPTVRTPM